MTELLFGYNTNGFAHHRLEDALQIIGSLGYQSVAITLDHSGLNPYAPDFAHVLNQVKKCLDQYSLSAVIETGARFLLDPWRKHQPTLLSPRPADRERRLDFLKRAVDIAAELPRCGAMSFWSGTPTDDTVPEALFARLVDGCRQVAEYADRKNVMLAFEPEPGMFIDTLDKTEELFKGVNDFNLGLTLDIGHLHCMGELPITKHVSYWEERIWNVHIEDMRRGVHEHLMLGEGEIDFPPVLRALRECPMLIGVHVELSRHSHDAVETARKALAFLKAAAAQGRRP